MTLSTSKDYNSNYLAQILKLDSVYPHPNAEKLQLAEIQNSVVVTDLTSKVGDIYVYCPVESQISSKFLSWSNSFRDPLLNQDKTAKGFFDAKGRVKMIKLRGEYSNGYIISFEKFSEFVSSEYGVFLKDIEENISFDTICGELFISKYEPPIQESSSPSPKTKVKKFDRLVENQFRLHSDTENLRKEIYKINPEDYISITNKYHGSNGVVSNVLIKRRLSFVEKIIKFLGIKVSETEYGMIYASRNVIKNKDIAIGVSKGFYKEDIWKSVADEVYPKLDKGISVYGEVIGWVNGQSMIQTPYDYGILKGQRDFLVFRIDYTNQDGEVISFSHEQIQAYCNKKQLKTPETYYYGKAKDLFDIPFDSPEWGKTFLKKLEGQYLDKVDPLCSTRLPMEGVVVSRQIPFKWDAYKLKDLKFLGLETQLLDNAE